MSRTTITNISGVPVSLPSPFNRLLPAGRGATVALTVEAVIVLLGGTAAVAGVLALATVPESSPVDTALGAGALARTVGHLTANVSTDEDTPQDLFVLPFTKLSDTSMLVVRATATAVYLNAGAVPDQNALRFVLQVDGVDRAGNAFLVPITGALESAPAYMFAVVIDVTGIAAGARVARLQFYLVLPPPEGDEIACLGTNPGANVASIEVEEVFG